MTNTYVSVGVSRIQTHLARCRSLWGRRGASDELLLLTTLPSGPSPAGRDQAATVRALMKRHPGVLPNDDALDIDGEVPLMGSDDAAVLAAGRDLVRQIQDRLPGVEASMRVWRADSYSKTLAREEPDEQETYVPPVREYPPTRPCDECQTDESVQAMSELQPPPPAQLLHLVVCRDCANRATQGRGLTVRTGVAAAPSGFEVERWLLETINAERAQQDLPKLWQLADFDNLAKQLSDTEGRTRSAEENHTALVFADANGLGGIFRTLRQEASKTGSTKEIRAISKAIKTATETALLVATRAIITPEDTHLPVIPHIRGGDDLLVSLPAPRLWQFFVTFMDELGRGFAAEVAPKVPPGLVLPSVSAGVVISKAEFPFGLQVDLVNHLIRQAKAHGKGKQWTFAWLDVTADGPVPVEGRTPWSLDELKQRIPALLHLRSAMGGSAEGSLRSDLSDPDLGSAALKVMVRAKRLKDTQTFLDELGIVGIPYDTDIRLLHDMISLGRWWR